MSNIDAGFMILCIIVLTIFFAGNLYGRYIMEREALDRGYAIYCSNTGDFAWAGECSSK